MHYVVLCCCFVVPVFVDVVDCCAQRRVKQTLNFLSFLSPPEILRLIDLAISLEILELNLAMGELWRSKSNTQFLLYLVLLGGLLCLLMRWKLTSVLMCNNNNTAIQQ